MLRAVRQSTTASAVSTCFCRSALEVRQQQRQFHVPLPDSTGSGCKAGNKTDVRARHAASVRSDNWSMRSPAMLTEPLSDDPAANQIEQRGLAEPGPINAEFAGGDLQVQVRQNMESSEPR